MIQICSTRAHVAGAEGFEPSNTGSKAPRLTAWPRPNRTLLRRLRSAVLAAALLTARFGRCLARRRRGAAHLLAVHREHLLLQVLAHLVVERVCDVLERAVLALLARHRHEQALGAVDDLDVGHDEA